MTRVLRDSSVLAAGSLASQAVMIAALPVVTRLYPAGDFGAFQLVLSLLMLLKPLANLQYNSAVMVERDDGDALNLMVLSLAVGLVWAALLGVAWVPLQRLLEPVLPDAALLLGHGTAAACLLLLLGWTQAVNSALLQARRFKLLALAGLATALGNRGGIVALGLAGAAGASGLLWGTAAGLLGAVLLTGALFVFPRLAALRGRLSLRRMAALARRYKDFPLYTTWSTELGMASRELPVVVLGLCYMPEVVGLYALSVRVVRVPLMLVVEPLSKVFLQRAVDGRGDPGRTARDFEEVTGLLVLLGLPVLLVPLFFGEPLFALCFGEAWRGVGTYAQILCPTFAGMLFYQVLGTVCIAFERQRLLLVLGAVVCGARVSSIAVCGVLGLSPLAAIAVFSSTSTLAYGLAVAVLLRLLGVPLTVFVRGLAVRSAGLWPLVAVFAATLFAARGEVGLILAGTVLGVAVQGAVFWRREPEVRRFVLGLVRRRP